MMSIHFVGVGGPSAAANDTSMMQKAWKRSSRTSATGKIDSASNNVRFEH